MGASLEQVTIGLGMPPAAVVETVFSRWSALVGPTIATHARPASVRGDLLVVNVDDPAWGTELRYQAQGLLSKIADSVGRGSPTRMEVRVRPRSARGWDPSVVNSAHRNSAP
jgi:predicted nucleic acid-binding Zn ribbon protein